MLKYFSPLNYPQQDNNNGNYEKNVNNASGMKAQEPDRPYNNEYDGNSV